MIPIVIDFFAIPFGRTLAGFVAALLLAFLGDLAARVFNLLVGFSWDPAVHQNAYFVGIGLGAGVGAYLGWLHLTLPRYLILGSLLLVLIGGIAGAYLGRFLGPGVDPTYWWSRFATDRAVYLGAATVGVIIATTWGIASQLLVADRSRPRFRSFKSSGVSPPGHSGPAVDD
jgi:hypothetical protein